MMYKNTPQLKRFLEADPSVVVQAMAKEAAFPIDEVELAKYQAELRHQGLPTSEIDDHAVFVCLTHDYGNPAPTGVSPLLKAIAALPTQQHVKRWALRAVILLVILWAILLGAVLKVHGQNVNPAIVVTTCGTAPSPYPAATNRAGATVDVNGQTCVYLGGAVTVTINTSGLATSANQLNPQPVSGTFWQATQPVSGTVAATESGTWNNRIQDGSGNGLTTNSTTYTAKFALDSNLLGTLGTAFSTAGKVDVKAADGDVFVRQATAANLNATVVGTGTFAVQATLQTQTDTVMVGGVNIKEINAITPLMGNGVTGTGSLRVTHASDNSAIANWGHGATGSAVPTGATYFAGNGSGNQTGVTVCDTWKNISLTADTAIITGVSAKKIYICALDILVSAADNVAIVEGTTVTTPCDTGTAGLFGGTTAATGWNFAANGGIAQGTGVGVLQRTATNADNVCILRSSAAQVSGAIAYTIY